MGAMPTRCGLCIPQISDQQTDPFSVQVGEHTEGVSNAVHLLRVPLHREFSIDIRRKSVSKRWISEMEAFIDDEKFDLEND